MIKDRIEKLREVMKKEGVDYYMVPTSDFHNSEYVSDYFKVREFLSGFTGSNGTLLISRTEALLWTDGRYFIQAQKELENTGIILMKMAYKDVPTLTEYVEKNIRAGEVFGFDARVVTASFVEKFLEKCKDKEIAISCKKDLCNEIWTDRPLLPHEQILLPDEALAGKSVSDKLEMLRSKMKENRADCLVLSKLDDIMWLYHIRGYDVPFNMVALSYTVITKESAYLYLQEESLNEEVSLYLQKQGVSVLSYSDFYADLTRFAGLRILFDAKELNYRIVKELEDAGAFMLECSNPAAGLKAVKNETELMHMREVYLKDSVCVTKFIYWLKQEIKAGKTLTELDAAYYMDTLRKNTEGFLDLSFPTISAYGANAAMMHYEATEEANAHLQPEGMLLVDSGGQYLGGTTDVTRTIVLGRLTEEMKRDFTLVLCGMLKLTNLTFLHGCTGRSLDVIARAPLWEHGLDYKCGTGHGIGYMLNVHEGPQRISFSYVEGNSEAVLEEGMAVTNEPGVYKENKYGIRTENVLVCHKKEETADGQFMNFETLTFVPIDLEAVDTEYMSEADKWNLNAYHKEVYEKIALFLTKEERRWLAEATREIL